MQILLWAVLAPTVHADDAISTVGSAATRELWIASGFLTAHFDQSKDLNGENYGLGAEYKFLQSTSVTVGRFFNSDREYSNYAGLIWQPYALGAVRLGVAVVAIDGYPKMRDGGWFPAAIPTATWEHEWFGLNVAVIPSYKDRLYGGITMQIKIKVFD